MSLTRVERERLTDSRLKIQSAANTLKQVAPEKVPDYNGIQSCLEGADESLRVALRAVGPDPPAAVPRPSPDRG